MKYNAIYLPQFDLKKTLKLTNELRNDIIKLLDENFELNPIFAPPFFPEGSNYQPSFDSLSRNITFDMSGGEEFHVGVLAISHTLYLRNKLLELRFGENQALLIEQAYIWRDFPESPTNSSTNYELVVQAIVADANKLAKIMTWHLYRLIYQKAALWSKNHKVENIYPQFVTFIHSEILNNEYQSKKFSEQVIEATQEHRALILVNSGLNLSNGHARKFLPSSLYDLNHTYDLIMLDRINGLPLEVVSVSKIALGSELSKQLNLSKQDELRQSPLYASALNSKQQMIEIRINLPKIIMALCAKAHLGEVQPGVYSNEKTIIQTKYKVDMY